MSGTSGEDPAQFVQVGEIIGGQAHAARMSKEERSLSASKASKAFWSRLSPEERSEEMRRRRAKGLKRKPQSGV